MKIYFPWKMVGEYEDGYEAIVSGYNEGDCMCKLVYLQDKHGNLTWYSGYEDEDYSCGEYIGKENFIYN